jgi:hypothetical protein
VADTHITGLAITAQGQSARIVYAFLDASGAGTDLTFTRTDTGAALAAKDGYLIRVVSAVIYGGAATQTVVFNTKSTSSAGVAIHPTIRAAANQISPIPVSGGFQGLTASRENETVTATVSGALGIMLQCTIENVSAATTTTPVTPPSAPPTAAVDWDAALYAYRDSGGTLCTEGDAVQEWVPKIGTYKATQTTTARRPKWRESQFNGKPALEFYLDDILPVTSGAMEGLVNGTNVPVTIFLVAKFNNLSATQILLGFAADGAATPQYRFGCYLGTNYVAWKRDDAATDDNLASGAIVNSSAHLLTFVIDSAASGTCKLFVRSAGDVATAVDTPTTTNSTYNGGAVTATNATFGALNSNATNSLFCDAFIGRCIIYSSALNDEQRTAVENELIGAYL